MNTQLQQLREQVLQAFSQVLKDPDGANAAKLTQLSGLIVKIEQRQKQLNEIEEVVQEIDLMLRNILASNHPQPSGSVANNPKPSYNIKNNGRHDQTKIKIDLDLSKLGLGNRTETICEHRASDSLVKFLERLYRKKGSQVLEQLSKLRVSRGPFVSNNPMRDFSYQSRTGVKQYQNQSIVDSGFFALTNTSTPQKVEDIRKACKFLNFPIGSVQVEQVEKFNDFEY